MRGRAVPAQQRTGRIASAQDGALDHGQAIGAGLTDKQIFGLRVAHLATRAAGGVVSHQSAAAIWGLLPPSPLPHVTLPATASARSRVAKVHRSAIPPIDRHHRDGFRSTSVSRTTVDLAGVLDRQSFEPLLDVVLCRKLASPGSLLGSSERGGARRGRELLRSSLEVWTPRIEPDSVAEVRLLRECAVERTPGTAAHGPEGRTAPRYRSPKASRAAPTT